MDTWYLSVHSAHLTGENAAELENHSWNGFGEGNRILEYAKYVLVETLTTDQNGKAVLNDLPLGSYKIVETKAPEGFVLNEIPQIVTFAYAVRKLLWLNRQQLLKMTVKGGDFRGKKMRKQKLR